MEGMNYPVQRLRPATVQQSRLHRGPGHLRQIAFEVHILKRPPVYRKHTCTRQCRFGITRQRSREPEVGVQRTGDSCLVGDVSLRLSKLTQCTFMVQTLGRLAAE